MGLSEPIAQKGWWLVVIKEVVKKKDGTRGREHKNNE